MRVRNYLERLNLATKQSAPMSYEDAIRRAGMASSFVAHPYWEVVSRMLSGTISSETEELLRNDEHAASNRSSVAICRKVLQMPFFDIEQGKLAESAYQHAVARMTRKRSSEAPESAEGIH